MRAAHCFLSFRNYEARGWCASRSLAQRTRLLGFKKNKTPCDRVLARSTGGAQANKQFLDVDYALFVPSAPRI